MSLKRRVKRLNQRMSDKAAAEQAKAIHTTLDLFTHLGVWQRIRLAWPLWTEARLYYLYLEGEAMISKQGFCQYLWAVRRPLTPQEKRFLARYAVVI